MRLVNALVGGVIGAAISAAIIVGVSKYMEVVPPDWLAIVAGVVTGLGVRIMGKSEKPGPSYLSGAIAALLTLAAFYGGTQAASNIMEAKVDQTQIKLHPDTLPDDMKTPPPVSGSAEDQPIEEDPSVAEDAPTAETPDSEDPATESDPAATTTEEPAAEPGDEPVAEAVVVEEEVEETVAPALPPVVKVDRPKPRAEEFNWLSFVFIAVGALIAYEMGRSCGCSKPA